MEAILKTTRELTSILKNELSPDWFWNTYKVKVLSRPKIDLCALCSIS